MAIQANEIIFNVNNFVKVKLTSSGFNYYKHLKNVPELQEPDKDGYTEFQLWELIQYFGDAVYLSCNPPFETQIILIESN